MVEQKYIDYWKARLQKKAVPSQVIEQKYIDYWRSRMAESDAKARVMEQEAWCEVRQAVALLRERFGATKAIVFGSLVRDSFGEDSDIDLAVAGLKSADFFSAITAINSGTKRWIDLKPLEDLEPRFRERVLATGQVIDEDS